MTAHNLAFGRMPVCVLRIGDFINTRIIINNVQINYSKDGMQWDLNPEGIGVQPMFAEVSLGITIIGGQSLNGPISRLQNAVSFNYYANTGVYDDRADRYKIGNDGKIIGFDKLFVIGGETGLNESSYGLYQGKDKIDGVKEESEQNSQQNLQQYYTKKTEGNKLC